MKLTEIELKQINELLEDYEVNMTELDKEALVSYNVEDFTSKEKQ